MPLHVASSQRSHDQPRHTLVNRMHNVAGEVCYCDSFCSYVKQTTFRLINKRLYAHSTPSAQKSICLYWTSLSRNCEKQMLRSWLYVLFNNSLMHVDRVFRIAECMKCPLSFSYSRSTTGHKKQSCSELVAMFAYKTNDIQSLVTFITWLQCLKTSQLPQQPVS